MDKERKREFKNRLYEQFARIGKALSSPRRLELLDLLAQGERTVEELSGETGMTAANTSQHLQTLRVSMLVSSRKSGTYIYYRLADRKVLKLWKTLQDVAKHHLADIDRIVDTFFEDRQSLQPISSGELLKLLKQNRVVVLDVRPRREYEAGHVRGSRNIPIKELKKRLTELPDDREIVAYCRGPYCVFADEAVKLLHERGYRVRRLDTGFPEWQLAGLPVEKG